MIQGGLLSVTSKSMFMKYSLGNSLVKLAQEKSVVTWADQEGGQGVQTPTPQPPPPLEKAQIYRVF